ncbi:MAG: DnaJ domain-containing protein, partial [Deltaproteobacteria bacterium]|nr:DnaJ domain-containing protein [Deltaproteobacteria bacterium]
PPQRERPAGMHVYSAKQESEPPIVETFESHRPPVHKSPPPSGPPPRSTRPLPSAPPAGTSRILTRPPSSTATPSQPPKSSSSPAPKVNSASQKPASPSPAPSTSTGPQRSATAAMGAAEGEIDLSEDRRKKIDDLYVVVDLLDHYQVLGIERDADRAKVKASYFELSKQFHPDTAFRKNVGSYRQKMEVIFKRLTEAYDVLSKKKAREEYDAYLSRSEKSHEYEQTLSGHHDLEKAMAAIEAEEARKRDSAKAQREADKAAELEKQQREAERRRAEEQRRLKDEGMGTPATPAVFSPRMGTSPGTRPSSQGIPAVKPPVSAPPPPIPPPTTTVPGVGRPVPPGTSSSPGSTTSPGGHAAPMSEEARQRAKELFTRRLAGSRSNTGPMEFNAPPEPARAPATKAEVVRDLAASLKGVANVTGGLDPAQRHVAEARRSLADGHLAEAVRKLRLAVALAPDDREIKTEHDRLARELAVSLASNYAEQAQYEERHGKWAAAAISWQKVVDGRPGDAACHWRCAKALLESSGDAKQAVRLAQRAVEIEPGNVFAVRTLGRAFMSAGMTLNAKRELEKAVALDPKDEPTKALLKELKGT